jgi:hypothetical protein
MLLALQAAAFCPLPFRRHSAEMIEKILVSAVLLGIYLVFLG